MPLKFPRQIKQKPLTSPGKGQFISDKAEDFPLPGQFSHTEPKCLRLKKTNERGPNSARKTTKSNL